MRVLITQSQPSANRLAERLIHKGHTPLVHPLLTVLPISTTPAHSHWDTIVVLSQHAAHLSAALKATTWWAIGDRTADALQAQGIQGVRVPSIWSSEGLLQDPRFKPKGRILILQGEHGLNHLADNLQTKGMDVTVHTTYRVQPIVDQAIVDLQADIKKGVDCVWIASTTALEHLISISDNTSLKSLESAKWVVASPRIQKAVQAHLNPQCLIDIGQYNTRGLDEGFIRSL